MRCLSVRLTCAALGTQTSVADAGSWVSIIFGNVLEHPKPVSEKWEEATHKLKRELWGRNVEQHEPDALQHDLLLQRCILCKGCSLVQQLDSGVRLMPNASLLDCRINVAGQNS